MRIGAWDHLTQLQFVTFMPAKIFGLAAVLGVGVEGDGGSSKFKRGGRMIGFPGLDFA